MIRFKSAMARQDSGPDITPLLDVVFILLIFFVISSVFTIKGLDMELPEAESAKAVTHSCLRIEIHEDGTLSCDERPVTLLDLDAILRHAAASPARRTDDILVKSAPTAHVEALVRVVDMARKHGLTNLIIAAKATAQGDAR